VITGDEESQFVKQFIAIEEADIPLGWIILI
jgi:hypothetical protein